MSYPLPDDPLGRAWIELSGTNPMLVDQYRPTLVAFLAFDRDLNASLQGTGFVLAGNSNLAIVITARHVLTEGIAPIQRPPTHATSAIFIPQRTITPSLSPEHLKVVWMGDNSVGLLNVLFASFNSSTDIAACIVAPQEIDPPPFEPMSVPFHTVIPRVGDIVQMVSIDKMDVSELAQPEDAGGRGQILKIFRRLSIRVGTVTGVYPQGYRRFKWPCFTTSIPAEPGMSGGFVYLPIADATVAACGVVSADCSTVESRTDQMLCGESIIACSWTALGLPVPEAIGNSSNHTLLDMVRSGNLDEPIGGINHLQIISDNGTVRIEMQNL
ncbi:hypothetical protein TUMEXPCC7403_07635 [Tumidithrix helvetica PCC 7403]|uniref:hypothetical protein n=1 Tax=Tumidithrix helvetica TaxID=3457545 RepID=UPI003C84AC80